MKPKFRTRIQLVSPTSKRKLNTKAEARVARSNIKTKQAQIRAAVKWSQENNARSYAALKTGMFPLIKSRSTIDSRLDGTAVIGSEKQYCSILTNEKEQSIVRLVRNKNRCLQGINERELTTLILDIIKIRDNANKKYKGGRGFCKLSAIAKRALRAKKLSRSFWKRWDAKHDHLRMKRQGAVSMSRTLNCTRDMACSHLNVLAQELIHTGIFTNAKQKQLEIWTG